MSYVLSTINHRIKWMYWLVLLPGLLFNVIDDFVALIWVEYLVNIAILIVIWRILNGHEKQLSDYYSNLEHKSLKWIRMIVILFAAFSIELGVNEKVFSHSSMYMVSVA
ncbi:hypothetical protein EMN47_03940 [Prolixibacteraceae bacterium JC049]|nr:hypothetical protein [Prolixibacteraceae bacterium JC049]